MKKFTFFTTALALLSCPVLANQNFIDGNTELYCETAKGKKVLLQADNTAVTYMFGKNLQQPEIVLKRPYAEVGLEHQIFFGGGGASVTLKNGKYEYTITIGFVKGRDIGTVSVYTNKGKEVAFVECSENFYIKPNSVLATLALQQPSE